MFGFKFSVDRKKNDTFCTIQEIQIEIESSEKDKQAIKDIIQGTL